MNHIIEVNNLVKEFGSKRAINDLSFTVNPGEVFGLLGPNGAGKTTTIRSIEWVAAGNQRRSANIRGKPDYVGGDGPLAGLVCSQKHPPCMNDLRARENLLFSGRLAGVPEAGVGCSAYQRYYEVLRSEGSYE